MWPDFVHLGWVEMGDKNASSGWCVPSRTGCVPPNELSWCTKTPSFEPRTWTKRWQVLTRNVWTGLLKLTKRLLDMTRPCARLFVLVSWSSILLRDVHIIFESYLYRICYIPNVIHIMYTVYMSVVNEHDIIRSAENHHILGWGLGSLTRFSLKTMRASSLTLWSLPITTSACRRQVGV